MRGSGKESAAGAAALQRARAWLGRINKEPSTPQGGQNGELGITRPAFHSKRSLWQLGGEYRKTS